MAEVPNLKNYIKRLAETGGGEFAASFHPLRPYFSSVILYGTPVIRLVADGMDKDDFTRLVQQSYEAMPTDPEATQDQIAEAVTNRFYELWFNEFKNSMTPDLLASLAATRADAAYVDVQYLAQRVAALEAAAAGPSETD